MFFVIAIKPIYKLSALITRCIVMFIGSNLREIGSGLSDIRKNLYTLAAGWGECQGESIREIYIKN